MNAEMLQQCRDRLRWIADDSGCWIWQFAKARHGYGIKNVRLNGRRTTQQAHRWVYEQLVGPVPRSLDLDHLCRVKACVNPDHLEPVPHAENVHRGRRSVLDHEKVAEIRRLSA